MNSQEGASNTQNSVQVGAIHDATLEQLVEIIQSEVSPEVLDAAITALYRKAMPVMISNALRIVDDSYLAEDLAQDAFLHFLDHLRTHKIDASLRVISYLAVITRNQVFTWMRRPANRSANTTLYMDGIALSLTDGIDISESVIEKEHILDALSQLSQREKEILDCFLTYRSVRDVAEVMKLSPPQVSSRLYRVRKHLAQLLSEE